MTTRGESEEVVRRTPRSKVRIWDEVTIRVGVGDYDFIRFTHGQEAIVPNNQKTKARAEQEMHNSIIEVVEARVTEYTEMIKEIGV